MTKRLLSASVAALALTFAVAACGSSSSRAPAAAGSSSSPAGRRRQHAGRPADVQMAVRLRQQDRRNGHLRRDRQRRRDRPDHLPHGRLRRLRRAADRRTVRRSRTAVEQIPWALSGTVPAYNVEGAPKNLKLSGEVLAGIYLGKITSWNDPAIAKLNPGASLPSTKITPVYRSDGSGDTYAFTNYLSTVDPEFKSKVGTSTQVKFPTGVGAEKNDGVAAAIAQTDGAIGYVGLAYALSNELSMPLVENSAGELPRTGREERRSGRRRGRQDRPEQRNLAGRPAVLGQGRLPDLDLHLRDRAAGNRKGGRS